MQQTHDDMCRIIKGFVEQTTEQDYIDAVTQYFGKDVVDNVDKLVRTLCGPRGKSVNLTKGGASGTILIDACPGDLYETHDYNINLLVEYKEGELVIHVPIPDYDLRKYALVRVGIGEDKRVIIEDIPAECTSILQLVDPDGESQSFDVKILIDDKPYLVYSMCFELIPETDECRVSVTNVVVNSVDEQ